MSGKKNHWEEIALWLVIGLGAVVVVELTTGQHLIVFGLYKVIQWLTH